MIIPEINSHITIVFKNSIQIDGIVIGWSEEEAVIKSLAGSSQTVIPNPYNDLLFYRITSAHIDYQNLVEKTDKSAEDLQKIADSKIELNNIERQQIKEQIITARHSEPTGNNYYGLPISAFLKPTALQHPNEEITSNNSSRNKELQSLFGQRNSNDRKS